MIDKEKWYRTGAVAKLLQTSPHRIRELARAGLIESQVRNGYRYFPGREVDRLLQEGLPPMPANTDLDAEDAPNSQQAPENVPRPGRNRLTQELYAEPSPQLAKSKEQLLRSQHSLERQHLEQQSQELVRKSREDERRAAEAQRVRSWHDDAIQYAASKVPGHLCTGVCSQVEALLKSVPPCTDVSRQVEEIVDGILRPIREREQEQRAIEVHRNRISQFVRSIQLPFEATQDEREEARELAADDLLRNLPLGASERQIRIALEVAIAPVVGRINQRKADEAKKRQEADHRNQINQLASYNSIFVSLGLRATREEVAEGQEKVRAVLEQMPAQAESSELSKACDRTLAPIKQAVQKREEDKRQREAAEWAATLKRSEINTRLIHLSWYVECRLRELEEQEDLHCDTVSDRNELRDDVVKKIRQFIVQELEADLSMSDTTLKKRIAKLVDKHYEEFCD